MLTPTILNSLKDGMDKEQIWRKVNNGFYEYTSLDRELRRLVEDGKIKKEDDKYYKVNKQSQLL